MTDISFCYYSSCLLMMKWCLLTRKILVLLIKIILTCSIYETQFISEIFLSEVYDFDSFKTLRDVFFIKHLRDSCVSPCQQPYPKFPLTLKASPRGRNLKRKSPANNNVSRGEGGKHHLFPSQGDWGQVFKTVREKKIIQ